MSVSTSLPIQTPRPCLRSTGIRVATEHQWPDGSEAAREQLSGEAGERYDLFPSQPPRPLEFELHDNHSCNRKATAIRVQPIPIMARIRRSITINCPSGIIHTRRHSRNRTDALDEFSEPSIFGCQRYVAVRQEPSVKPSFKFRQSAPRTCSTIYRCSQRSF